MKNIYITDLDHTFLRNDLSISDFTRNTWNTFAKKNIMSIATARTFKKTQQFLKDIEINAPMILLDGALIATQDKKIIDTKFISKDVADNIIEIGAKFGIYPFVFYGLTHISDRHMRILRYNKLHHHSMSSYFPEDMLGVRQMLSLAPDLLRSLYTDYTSCL